MSGDLRSAALDMLFAQDLPIGLALLDSDLRYCAINATLARANGLEVAAHLGRSVVDVLPQAAHDLIPLLRGVLETGRPHHFQIDAEVPSLPGVASEWDASYLPVKDDQGQVAGVLVRAANRSQERADERLRRARQESDQRLRRVLDNLFVFVGVLSPDGRVQEANRAPLDAGGFTLEQIRGREFWLTPWWTHDPLLVDWLKDAAARVARGETVRRDVVVRMAGDTRMDIDFMMAPLRDDQGRVTHLIPSGIDISARRESERALARSEDRFRRAFEGATIGMGLIDTDGRIQLANESLARMFGYTRDELAGKAVHDLVPTRQREAHHGHVGSFMRQPALRYMAKRQELYALRRDGTEIAVEIGLNPMPDSDGQQVLATVNDVTERRAAQSQIERALQEKTALLNEVHHRVKNNLQVISSLLSLQARHADDRVRDALRDSQSRVHSMSLLHQLLYERSDFSALEMGTYLRRLIQLLRDTYLGQSPQIDLLVETPQDLPWRMELQRAIPCGLVVTELVTNAIKHAFPDGRTGQIRVRLGGTALGEVGSPPAATGGVGDHDRLAEADPPWLEVVDDGVGLPPGMAPGQGRSLGLQLLPLLADQCGARLGMESQAGTRARLTWCRDAVGEAHA
ncbi:PAS domain-containing protein [Roseateles amylovorans]|uniref:PAS domain-containing protein n=1 Tax=Roseateles amylovorans TaxID=2978473 RepID=A0ABY6B0C6_9BURK|nr:PAS domain-containing protein [Roseateles amylovorans]UXH78851.1 PAS domain-containing protein [Roseateles amylovorans]